MGKKKPDKEKLAAALEECRVYNRMGGLNHSVIADIAHDHGVSFETLRDAFYE